MILTRCEPRDLPLKTKHSRQDAYYSRPWDQIKQPNQAYVPPGTAYTTVSTMEGPPVFFVIQGVNDRLLLLLLYFFVADGTLRILKQQGEAAASSWRDGWFWMQQTRVPAHNSVFI